jgi:hypothetical protein
MPVIFTKDTLRASVEAATGGKVTVLYDDKGYPSYMVRIPKFNLEDIDPALGTGVHPAFIVGGIEKSEILIGQFQAKVVDGRACSLPGVDPTTYVTFDQAINYCKAKGSGWHLMTAWEWAAVVLWCMKNGFQPRGNTNYGRSYEATYETGARIDGGSPGSTSGTSRILTGSGPASWRHDNTYAGISDLVGNVWEWQYGLKLVDGRFVYTQDNNYALSESSWYQSGVYVDSTAASDGDHDDDGAYEDVGDPIIADSIVNRTGPVGSDEYYDYTYLSAWKSMTVNAAHPDLAALKQMLIAPTLAGAGQLLENVKGAIWVRNYGERVPLRGGDWYAASYAGMAALSLYYRRSGSGSRFGFRPAFVG